MGNDDGFGQKKISRVCGMCVAHLWYILFGYCVLYALGFLIGVMTISFALPIDLYKSLWTSENG